jgi:hypothetical protein
MLEQAAAILLTAVLSSLFTLAGARWALGRWMDELLRSKSALVAGEMERRLRQGFDTAIASSGARILNEIDALLGGNRR